jgi:hypothetical protein
MKVPFVLVSQLQPLDRGLNRRDDIPELLGGVPGFGFDEELN